MKSGMRKPVLFLTVLLVPAVSYFTIFMPQKNSMDTANADIAQKRDLPNPLRPKIAQSKDLESVTDSLHDRIKLIESRLPTNKDVEQIVRQVSDLAIEAGLQPPAIFETPNVNPDGKE